MTLCKIHPAALKLAGIWPARQLYWRHNYDQLLIHPNRLPNRSRHRRNCARSIGGVARASGAKTNPAANKTDCYLPSALQLDFGVRDTVTPDKVLRLEKEITP